MDVKELAARADSGEFSDFRELVRALRGGNGCPWDKKQTLNTLIKYIREETEEAVEQIEAGSDAGACEELGDVFLILTMMVQVAEDEGRFTLEDVMRGISEKVVRRHPHVFGGLEVKDDAEVLANWNRIKEEEKKSRL